MKCNYIIKLPNGRDYVIPTNFSTIEKTSELKDIFNSTSLDNISPLVDYILKETNSDLSREFIVKSITDNLDNLDGIITTINDNILNNPEYVNFEKALSTYFAEDKSKIKELQDLLNTPVDLKYFKDISATGLIGSTSIEKQHLKIKSHISESNVSGKNISLYYRIDTFLNHLKSKNLSEYFGNVLLENSSVFGVQAVNVDNYTVFQTNDYTSLFLGLFKRYGSKLNPELLNTKFGNSKFFTSSIDIDGNIELSDFEKLLLSKDPSSKKILNEVIKEVSDYISPNNGILRDAIKDLFIFLKPEIYVEETVTNTLLKEEYLNREYKFEQEYKTKEDYLHLITVKDDLDTYYAPARVVSDDLYNFVTNNINIREDLVQLPVSDTFKPYVLLTNVYHRKDGVFLQGDRIDSEGNRKVVKLEIKNGTTLFYRKREEAKDPYIPGEIIQKSEDRFPLNTKTKFNTTLLKNIIRKGDTIGEKHIVVGVYPNYVLTVPDYKLGEVLTDEDFSKILYKNIKSVKSAELQRIVDIESNLDWNNLNKYNTIQDMNLLSEGDIIVDPTANKRLLKTVLLTDDNYVYVYINGKDSEFLKPIKKSDIKEAKSFVYNQIPINELSLLKNDVDNFKTRNAKLSTFVDPNSAKDEDMFVYDEEDGTKVYGKILNSKIGKAVVWSIKDTKPRVVNYLELGNLQFYTKRKIASNYAMSILRANNWDIKFLSDPSPLNVKLRYIVPKGTDISKLYLLPNYYASIGMYKDYNYPLTEDEIDVTDTIKDLLESGGVDLSGKDIYAKKISENSNVYERNQVGLNRVYGFDKLSFDVKKALDPLQPGVYFFVYDGININNDIYRVVKNNGDTVVAHLNKINNDGNLLTFERTFNVDTLLASKQTGDQYAPSGSIAGLLVQWGNKNFNTIVDAVNKNLSAKEVTSRKSINILINKMSDTFKNLGIMIEQSTEGFEGGQKAKLETDEIGNVKIVLNDKDGGYSDLVHENLHVYLTLLRYNSLEEYNYLINTIIEGDTVLTEDQKHNLLISNIYDKEEFAVNKIVDLNNGFNAFLASDLKNFMKILAKVVTNHVNPAYEFRESALVNNPLEFLNTRMRDFYGINTLDNNSPYYNIGILAFEPTLRNWMKNENITLKCD